MGDYRIINEVKGLHCKCTLTKQYKFWCHGIIECKESRHQAQLKFEIRFSTFCNEGLLLLNQRASLMMS